MNVTKLWKQTLPSNFFARKIEGGVNYISKKHKVRIKGISLFDEVSKGLHWGFGIAEAK